MVRFLGALPPLKARTALTTAYAAGLRASEVVSLNCFPDAATSWDYLRWCGGGKETAYPSYSPRVGNGVIDQAIKSTAR
ncbi:hypothetical protein BAE40_13245 [Mesorhizobium loti]|nr:hypothetical protein BAE40_13245 [Mesorhizobium loti]